jgi:cyclin-dependent kinase regulatory subunit CKS1
MYDCHQCKKTNNNTNQHTRTSLNDATIYIQYYCSHVILPKDLAKTLPKSRLLTENEWRTIGVQQSRGWQHYAIHRPEPHILLFRRPLGTDPQSGRVDPNLIAAARDEYKNQFGVGYRK